MRILLLSFEYPKETGFGGIGTYAWYQARALSKLGHEVEVLAGATSPTDLRTESHDGVKVHRYRSNGLWMRALKRLDKHRLWWTKNRLENAYCMYRGLRALLRDRHYDVIEMPECGAEGALINHLQGGRNLVKFHSPAALIMSCYDVRKADVRWCSFVERIGIDAANALTSCSRFLADEVRTKLRVKTEIKVIPNGIDVELFDREEQIDAREKYGIPRHVPMVLFAGRMEPRKGIHLFREIVPAIAKGKKVAFVFAGSDLFNTLQNDLLPYWKSKNLKGSVHFLGKLDLVGVGSCLRQADVFMIPSLWENCPYSCLEAMAAGRALLASDAGGLPEIVRHEENGLIARSEDVPGFTAALERLIEDAPLRDRLGRAARRTIEHGYTDTHVAQMSVDYYRHCFG